MMFLMEFCISAGIILLPFLLYVVIRKTSVMHGLGIILLGIYLGMVWNITGLPSVWSFQPEIRGGVSLTPFRDVSIFGYMANTVMLIPLGFLLPFLWKRYRKLWKAAAAGFCTSLCIELLQLFTFRATDIDDLIMNTLGTLLGFLLYLLLSGCFPGLSRVFLSGDLTSSGERKECAFVIGLVILIMLILYPKLSELLWGILYPVL